MSYRVIEEKLIFNNDFNEPIEGPILDLISKYEHIHFGMQFNQSLDNLPPNVKSIVLECDESIPLKNLPDTLKSLSISTEYNLPLEDLPNSIENLILGNHTLRFSPSPFPSLDNLPNGIKKLEIRTNIPIVNLPDSIQHIILGIEFKNPIEKLPANLISLSMSDTHPQANELKLMYPDIVQLYTCIDLKKTSLMQKMRAKQQNKN